VAFEKRKTQRLNLAIEALCKAGEKLFKAYVGDISPGGLRLETETRIEKGQEITFTIEWKRPLKLKGTVRWKEKQGLHYLYGIQFVKLTPDQEASIREIIQDLFWKNYGG